MTDLLGSASLAKIPCRRGDASATTFPLITMAPTLSAGSSESNVVGIDDPFP